MGGKPALYRRKMLVDRGIQTPLLVFIFFMTTFSVMVMTLVSVLWASLSPEDLSSGLRNYLLLGGVALVYVVIAVAGLYVTNKVAGPLYRMKQHMAALNRGEPKGPLSIRVGDFLDQELIDEYNTLVKDKVTQGTQNRGNSESKD